MTSDRRDENTVGRRTTCVTDPNPVVIEQLRRCAVTEAKWSQISADVLYDVGLSRQKRLVQDV